MVCMVVSRFFKFPIQNEFFGKRLVGPSALSRVGNPSGVGGYMRKRDWQQSVSALKLQRLSVPL
jgi:hypothetical protein